MNSHWTGQKENHPATFSASQFGHQRKESFSNMLPTTLPFPLRHFLTKSVEGETHLNPSHHIYYANTFYSKQEKTSKMGVPQKWFRNIVRGRFLRSSNKDIVLVLPRTSICTNECEEAMLRNEEFSFPTPISSITKEDASAIKIQAYFRGHLVCHLIPAINYT